MNTPSIVNIGIQDSRCYTVSAYRKRIKVRDLLSLVRLAVKLASKEDGKGPDPLAIALFADAVVDGKSSSFHLVLSRDATACEHRHITEQLTRSCEVLGRKKPNRLVHGIHCAADYLFHDGHSFVFTKQLFG